MTRAFLPEMRARGAGRIINVGSMGGRITFPLMGAYHATKYAVEALSDALRNELAPFGIHVSLIEPGAIHTEFADRSMDVLERYRAEGSPYLPILTRAEEVPAEVRRDRRRPRGGDARDHPRERATPPRAALRRPLLHAFRPAGVPAPAHALDGRAAARRRGSAVGEPVVSTGVEPGCVKRPSLGNLSVILH
jgi:NAD(P)-dependent dehydrogenase (short-subunit alcohol dehydrogenase family)